MGQGDQPGEKTSEFPEGNDNEKNTKRLRMSPVFQTQHTSLF